MLVLVASWIGGYAVGRQQLAGQDGKNEGQVVDKAELVQAVRSRILSTKEHPNTERVHLSHLLPSGSTLGMMVGHSAVKVGQHVYVFGGGDGKMTNNQLHVLDVVRGRWETPQTTGEYPGPRMGHCAGGFGTDMFVFGGYAGGIGYVDEVFQLDVSTLQWSRPQIIIQSMWDHVLTEDQLPRIGHASCCVQQNMYIFGGSRGETLLDDMIILDMENRRIQLVSTTTALPHSCFPATHPTLTLISGMEDPTIPTPPPPFTPPLPEP